MLNPFSVRNRMKRLYRDPKENIYTYRFFTELCSGYSYKLGDRSGRRAFYTFEPKGCKLSKLIMIGKSHNLSYRMEEVIDEIANDLLAFGSAYIYIEPHYTKDTDKEQQEFGVLSSANLVVIKGIIKRRSHSGIQFYRWGKGETVQEMHMKSNQLVEFDIRELGYSKRYFTKKIERLEKYDITCSSAFKGANHVEGYDISLHSRRNKLGELKALKDIGWSLGPDGLSDSYILYKNIQINKLRIRILKYILDKLNCGFELFLGELGGSLRAHVKEINYDQLWRDYTEGKITETELSDLLF